MKVFFGCEAKEVLKYKDYYLAIRDAVKQTGHTLTRDWIDPAIERAEKDEEYKVAQYYPAVVSAILDADAVVLEGTIQSVNVGHELSVALQKGKPLLYLSQLSPEELKGDFLGGTESPLLTLKSYKSVEEVKQIVEDFLSNMEGGVKARFNLVMDKDQDNYLEWAAFTYKKSKTELIKNAIDVSIQADERYKGYVKSLD